MLFLGLECATWLKIRKPWLRRGFGLDWKCFLLKSTRGTVTILTKTTMGVPFILVFLPPVCLSSGYQGSLMHVAHWFMKVTFRLRSLSQNVKSSCFILGLEFSEYFLTSKNRQNLKLVKFLFIEPSPVTRLKK